MPRIPEDRRVRLVCDSGGQAAEIEIEGHMLFSCGAFLERQVVSGYEPLP